MSPRTAPRQGFEHEYQTEPIRAEIKRVVDCDQLLSHETMILATMLPQTAGLLFTSILLLLGNLVQLLNPVPDYVISEGMSASFAFAVVVMPSMCSGYLWISLCYLSFWTNMREGWLKRTIVWFLCLLWAATYCLLFYFTPGGGLQVIMPAAFGPLSLAVLAPLVYTSFRLRGLKGMGQRAR
jgi:hypothetical protein